MENVSFCEECALMTASDSNPTDQICIDRLLVRGIVGIHEWERSRIQDIVVSVTLHVNLQRVGSTDNVHDSVDYSDVSKRIMIHVEAASRYTIEALATDIAGLCLSSERVIRAQVRVSKPSAERFAQSIAVEIDRTRDMLVTTALISLGSNADPLTNMRRAVSELNIIGPVRGISTVYESAAIGHAGDNYLNAIIRVDTCLPAGEIHRILKAIEVTMGRTADSKEAGRIPIDLDLCMLGSQVIRANDVSIPDQDILTREYLARGCAELMPDAVYPETGTPLSSIAQQLAGSMQLHARPEVTLIAHQGSDSPR